MGMYSETVQYVQCVTVYSVTVYSVTVYSTYCGVTVQQFGVKVPINSDNFPIHVFPVQALAEMTCWIIDEAETGERSCLDEKLLGIHVLQ